MPPSSNDGAANQHPEAGPTIHPAPPPSRSGLRKIFWVAAFALVLLAVAALGTTGYLAQQELRGRLDELQAELDAAHQQLSQERDRAQSFESTLGRVHELAGQLSASLRELQTLTAPRPIASSRPEATPAPPAASEAERQIPSVEPIEKAVAEEPAREAVEVEPVPETAVPEETAGREPAEGQAAPAPGQSERSERDEVVAGRGKQAPTGRSLPTTEGLDKMPSVLELKPALARSGAQPLLAPGDIAGEAPILPPAPSLTEERGEEPSEAAHEAPRAE